MLFCPSPFSHPFFVLSFKWSASWQWPAERFFFAASYHPISRNAPFTSTSIVSCARRLSSLSSQVCKCVIRCRSALYSTNLFLGAAMPLNVSFVFFFLLNSPRNNFLGETRARKTGLTELGNGLYTTYL